MAVRCSQLGVKISSLLDRELNEIEARWLRNHVESCARCRREYRELRSARLSARALGHHEPPVDFWRGMTDRMDALDARVEPEPTDDADGSRQARRFPGDAFGHVLALVVAVSILSGLVVVAAHDRLLFPGAEPAQYASHLITGHTRRQRHTRPALTPAPPRALPGRTALSTTTVRKPAGPVTSQAVKSQAVTAPRFSHPASIHPVRSGLAGRSAPTGRWVKPAVVDARQRLMRGE